MPASFFRTHSAILLLVPLKLLVHLLTNTRYGFHRDEYLYLEQGHHLAWGYMEVPPMIAFLARGLWAFGAELWQVRLLTALVGTLLLLLMLVLIRKCGGGTWAQWLGGIAFLVAPAFLRTHLLFQPVAFNQFFWFLSCFLVVRLIQTQDHRYWYGLGVVAGLGFLTKYSIAFLFAAFFLGFLFTRQRHWLATRYPFLAMGLALLIALPNLWWQAAHHWPVWAHMQELARTQLVNVRMGDFVSAQFLMPFGAAIVWIPGLIYALRSSTYRLLGIAFIGVQVIIALLAGKPYYTLGVFPILFVFGGIALERWIPWIAARVALGLLMTVSIWPILPISLPMYDYPRLEQYCQEMYGQYGLDGPIRWEDGRLHHIPQDFADMTGWEEMAQKVIQLYHSLPPDEQARTSIFGGSYGHAGAINYYGRDKGLPEAQSLSSSFMIWADPELDFDIQIFVESFRQDSTIYFSDQQLVDSVENPYARDRGYIYLRRDPTVEVQETWRRILRERKAPFGF